MHVEINYRDLAKSDRLNEHITESIDHHLSRYDSRITRVEVHVGDINGHKPGENDKRCMMEARPKGLPPVVSEAYAGDIYNAVRDATNKLGRVLERRLARHAS
ncbi:MAG: HPF/RaiA family ribosome-associated protein [Planctomycetota bacterium]